MAYFHNSDLYLIKKSELRQRLGGTLIPDEDDSSVVLSPCNYTFASVRCFRYVNLPEAFSPPFFLSFPQVLRPFSDLLVSRQWKLCKLSAKRKHLLRKLIAKIRRWFLTAERENHNFCHNFVLVIYYFVILFLSTDAKADEFLQMKIFNHEFRASDSEMYAILHKANLVGNGYKREAVTKVLRKEDSGQEYQARHFMYIYIYI